MARIPWFRWNLWGLRSRITVWYVLLVGLTLIAFSSFVYFRIQNSLVSQLDASLEAASSQALSSLGNDDDHLIFENQVIEYIGTVASFNEDQLYLTDGTNFSIDEETKLKSDLSVGSLVEVDTELSNDGLYAVEIEVITEFDNIGDSEKTVNFADLRRRGDISVSIIAPDGTLWDTLGDQSNVPYSSPEGNGFTTSKSSDGFSWRVHTVGLRSASGENIGWLQTARPLESAEAALGSFRLQLLWGIPLVLALAGAGGLFVADRGLRPIDQITRTAQTVSSSALGRRINNQGPKDEVGRLADTFDAMLDRLEDAFERERRFTSDASHELRTPLTSIKGRVEVTLTNPRSPEEYRETLRVLQDEVDRLIRLSNELLFLARLDEGRVLMQSEKVNAAELLGAVIDQARTLAEKKNLTVIDNLSPDICLQGDPDHLIRLFLNLTDNALKYTPPGGSITIGALMQGSNIRVIISDNGPGISSEHLPHIFQRFYRADVARSRDSGGTGLGLAIANEIVQIHGGSMEVKSEVGSGTTFTISLPSNS